MGGGPGGLNMGGMDFASMLTNPALMNMVRQHYHCHVLGCIGISVDRHFLAVLLDMLSRLEGNGPRCRIDSSCYLLHAILAIFNIIYSIIYIRTK